MAGFVLSLVAEIVWIRVAVERNATVTLGTLTAITLSAFAISGLVQFVRIYGPSRRQAASRTDLSTAS